MLLKRTVFSIDRTVIGVPAELKGWSKVSFWELFLPQPLAKHCEAMGHSSVAAMLTFLLFSCCSLNHFSSFLYCQIIIVCDIAKRKTSAAHMATRQTTLSLSTLLSQSCVIVCLFDNNNNNNNYDALCLVKMDINGNVIYLLDGNYVFCWWQFSGALWAGGAD